MNTRQTRLTLLGLSLGVLLALLLSPQTRWLVRAQLLPFTLSPERIDRQKHLFVQQHPDDFQIRLAGALSDTSQTPLASARSLVPRFLESASLRANILRYATEKDVQMHRDEDYLVNSQPVPSPQVDPHSPPPTPAALAAFDADAAAGERLDPDNAYFPYMRAVGLFAAHRDREGFAAVQRASTKHLWREYFEDEVEGRWRITDALYGGREAVSALSISAALLFPEYAELRAAARVVLYKAILEEQAGHPEAGFALRLALGRCGELMQVQSTTLIGSLVGGAINAISRGRPGGVPPLKFSPQVSSDQRAQERLNLYCAYVTKIGHPEAAAEAKVDFQSWQQIHHIASKLGDSFFGGPLSELIYLAIALVAGWVLIPNICIVLVLGLMTRGLGRLPRFQQRQPLPVGATAGFWSVPLLALLLAALYLDAGTVDFSLYAFTILFLLFVIVGAVAWRAPKTRRPLANGLLTAALTIGGFGLFVMLASWPMHGGWEITRTVQQITGQLVDASVVGAEPWYNTEQGQTLIGAALSLLIPALFAVILSIVSRVKRVPASAGLVTGFTSIMPPLVFGLMLVYGGLTLWTVRQEARVSQRLEQSLHGEGQYLAQMTGETWPVR